MGNQKGSYTVEAALLMGVLLYVLAAVIYLGFYMHDRGFLQGAAHEAACAMALHAEDTRKADVSQRLIQGKLLGTRNASARISDGKKKAIVHYQGRFLLPSFLAPFFGNTSPNMESKVTLTMQRPTVLIQKLRGAAKIVNRVRGD